MMSQHIKFHSVIRCFPPDPHAFHNPKAYLSKRRVPTTISQKTKVEHVLIYQGCSFNALANARQGCNLKLIIFNLKLSTDMLSISCEMSLMWIVGHLVDD